MGDPLAVSAALSTCAQAELADAAIVGAIFYVLRSGFAIFWNIIHS